MSELPVNDPHEVIHLGEQAAVVVPLNEYRHMRDEAARAQLIEQADAEEAAALADYRARQEAGTVVTVPQSEVRRRFGLAAETYCESGSDAIASCTESTLMNR